MKIKLTLTLSVIALLFMPVIEAADAKHGQQLHNTNCVACHAGMTGGDGATLYTRQDRRVTTLQGLNAQVMRCATNLDLKWFDDDVADVTQYLDSTYYKFPTSN